MQDLSFSLHLNAIKGLAIAFAYLLAFIATYRLRNLVSCSEEYSAVRYIYLGFSAGFLGYLVTSILDSYIVMTPILPIILAEQGLPASKIAEITGRYVLLFQVFYTLSVYVATFLIAYGAYSLVVRRCRD